jgi:hypothetical protein
MKNFLLLSFLMIGSCKAFCQSASDFSGDADKVFQRIRTGVYKNNYQYLIKFAATNEAAINVEPNTSYVIFFVYDNSAYPATDFEAHLMTPDSALMKKYTLKPFDRGQIGVARAEQMEFRTPNFTSGNTRPVKLNANPKAYLYIFYKK